MTSTAGKIYGLIPKIMSEVGAISKERKNPQQGYMFRGIDDVYQALQGPLAKHGVFYAPEVLTKEREERQTKTGGTLLYTMLTMRFTFYAEDGSNVSIVTVGEAMDSADKSSNKAMSAALKYALLQMFCIPTEEDNDTENQTHVIAPKTQVVPQVPAVTAKPRKPIGETSGVFCEACGTELVLSSSGAGYFCPKYRDQSKGEHTRFPVAKLDAFKQYMAEKARAQQPLPEQPAQVVKPEPDGEFSQYDQHTLK